MKAIRKVEYARLSRFKEKGEIFYSLQGEGKSIGKPSIFIRFSSCNLYCHWCDTPYTWNWEGTKFEHISQKKYNKEEESTSLQISEVIEQIRSFPCKNLVFTGGEPLLQQPAMYAIMYGLRKIDPSYQAEVETNGTIVAYTELDKLVHQYNVSPKLSNSAVSENLRTKEKALLYFTQNEKSNFKFVIEDEKDEEEVLSLVLKYRIPKHQVYIMPQASNKEDLAQKAKRVALLCQKHGWSYSDRLHIRLYNDERGK